MICRAGLSITLKLQENRPTCIPLRGSLALLSETVLQLAQLYLLV